MGKRNRDQHRSAGVGDLEPARPPALGAAVGLRTLQDIADDRRHQSAGLVRVGEVVPVRRAGATTGLRVLELAGALKIRRGGVGIRGRAALMAIAGPSYGVPEAEYARILAGV